MVYLVLLRSLLYMKSREKRNSKIWKYKKRNRSDKKYTLCRLCNEGKGEISIFHNTLLIDIAQEIQKLSGVILKKTDKSSKYVCKSCLEQLDGCIKFRELCRRNNSYIQTTKKHHSKELSQTIPEISVRNVKEVLDDLNTDEHHCNYESKVDHESYSLPSPTFSDEYNYASTIWNCPNCQQPFQELDSYNLHLLSCNNQCDKNQNDGLKRRFLCDICGKTISTLATLNIHRKIHKDIFPFHCDICPYRGRTLDLLRVHKRIHLSVKPYKCTLCPKTVTTASNLQRHMRNAHSTARPFKCNHCDRTYRLQRDVDKHMREVHIRQDVVHCPLCDKTLSSQNALSKHRLKVHKIKGRNGRMPSYLICENAQEMDGGEYT